MAAAACGSCARTPGGGRARRRPGRGGRRRRRGRHGAEAAAEAEERGLDPEDDIGVEIEITPAGKAMKRLTLLSGGEKSMTAHRLPVRGLPRAAVPVLHPRRGRGRARRPQHRRASSSLLRAPRRPRAVHRRHPPEAHDGGGRHASTACRWATTASRRSSRAACRARCSTRPRPPSRVTPRSQPTNATGRMRGQARPCSRRRPPIEEPHAQSSRRRLLIVAVVAVVAALAVAGVRVGPVNGQLSAASKTKLAFNHTTLTAKHGHGHPRDGQPFRACRTPSRSRAMA